VGFKTTKIGVMMKDFPIDSKGDIGRKRVKVPSAMIDDIQESRLKEIIREMVRGVIGKRK